MSMEVEKKTGKLNVICMIVLAVILASFVFIFADANIFHYTCRMDSDVASETLVGVRIFENSFSTPETWVGSTHKWIVMTPNLEALLYPVTGRNMNLSMGISCSVFLILLVLSALAFYKFLGLSRVEALSGVILLLALTKPFDESQRMLFLHAAYYASHFITLFIILICYKIALEKDKLTVPVFIFTGVLACINGLQGLHACLFCYIPLLGAELIRRIVFFFKKKKSGDNGILVWVCVLNAASYIAQKAVNSYGTGASRNLRHAPEKFAEFVWPFFKEVISFERVPVLAAAVCVMALFGFVFTGIGAVKGDEKSNTHLCGDELCFYPAIVMILGVLLCVFLTTLTTSEAAPRYYVMELFVVGTGTALFIRKLPGLWKLLPVAVVLVIGISSALYQYDSLVKEDNSGATSEMQVVHWMEQKGYGYGYSTFEHANTITVLANNKIQVRALNNMMDLEGSKWLSDKIWYPPFKKESGPVCYIFTDGLKGEFDKFLEKEDPQIIENVSIGSYKIYVLGRDYSRWVD